MQGFNTKEILVLDISTTVAVFHSLNQGGSTWNLIKIAPVTSAEKSFENMDNNGWAMDQECMMAWKCLLYSSSWAFGSGKPQPQVLFSKKKKKRKPNKKRLIGWNLVTSYSLAQKTWHFSCFQFCECVHCSQWSFLLESIYLKGELNL